MDFFSNCGEKDIRFTKVKPGGRVIAAYPELSILGRAQVNSLTAGTQVPRLPPLTSPVLSVHWKSLSTILSFRPIHVFSRPKPVGCGVS